MERRIAYTWGSTPEEKLVSFPCVSEACRRHRYMDSSDASPNSEAIADQLKALLTPAIWSQLGYYRQLGLRDSAERAAVALRILNLPLIVAAVLTLLWRQVPGVKELTRLLAREDLLWCRATKVSQQALSERFLTFPAELFERVFKDLLPQLQKNWLQRNKLPLPDSIKFALKHFERIWVADGLTLEALFRKLKSLEDVPRGQLAGKICGAALGKAGVCGDGSAVKRA